MRGAALRKPTTAKNYVMEKQREQAEELLGRLAKVDLLRALPPEEMEQNWNGDGRGANEKQRVEKGDAEHRLVRPPPHQ